MPATNAVLVRKQKEEDAGVLPRDCVASFLVLLCTFPFVFFNLARISFV